MPHKKAGEPDLPAIRKNLQIVAVLSIFLSITGCSQKYVTPGGGVDLRSLDKVTDVNIREALERKPASPFPARLAYIRLQELSYRSYSIESSYGRGNYSVVTTRDIEKDEHFDKIRRLPMIESVTPLSRILLPQELKSDRELRGAAAQLHSDLLLVYTLDTIFRVKDYDIGPLGIMTLGFLPNQEAKVTTTASAVIYDVRTGYVYGLAETTTYEKQMASVWISYEAVEESRIRAETRAFEQLLDELTVVWKGIVEQYAAGGKK